jgi:hypothetical protein
MSNPTLFASGTQTAVINTEHVLSDVNVAGTYIIEINTVNMAANDVVEFRIYTVTLTGGTRRVAYFTTYYGVQPVDDIQKISLPIGNDLTDATSVEFTLKQTFGTGRNFDWKILQYI